MAIWRLVRHFIRRSKGAITWIWLSLVWLALFTFVAASSWPSLLFDGVRACLSLVPFFSSRFGREIAVLPIGRRNIWRAKWLLATVGVTALTASARLVAFYLPFGVRGLRPTTPLAMLGLVDLLEAGMIAACVAMLVRPRSRRARAAFRARRWLASLTLLSAPWWGHLIDNHVMATGGSWTAEAAGLLIVGVVLTLLGAASPNMAYAGREAEAQPSQSAHTSLGPDPATWNSSRALDRPNAATPSFHTGLRRPSRGRGALGFVGREVLQAAGMMAAALTAVVIAERLVTGQWSSGRDGSAAFFPALVIVLALNMPGTQRARLLRTLPISTDVLVLLPTVLLGVAWATATALFAGFHRLALGVWPPSPFALTVLEMGALTSLVKSLSLPWAIRRLVPIVAGAPLFAFATLLPPLDGHMVLAVIVSLAVIAGTIAADYYTFTRSKRVYERVRSLWG